MLESKCGLCDPQGHPRSFLELLRRLSVFLAEGDYLRRPFVQKKQKKISKEYRPFSACCMHRSWR